MNGLCRIYYFKAGATVTPRDPERDDAATREMMQGKLPSDQTYNPVRMLGTNCSWTEIGSKEYHTKLKNLCAARNAKGELAYCVFTSECFDGTERTIDDVIRSLLGGTWPAGLYVNF